MATHGCPARAPMTIRIVRGLRHDGGVHLAAQLFHETFPGAYAYLGRSDGWYAFKQPRWYACKRIGSPLGMFERIGSDVSELVMRHLRLLEAEQPPAKADVNAVNRFVIRLHKVYFKEAIIRTLQHYYRPKNSIEWLQSLDSDDYILGFDDRVYDFREKKFRDGRPDDMLTLTVGHDSSLIEEPGDDIAGIRRDIEKVLRDMHPDEEHYEYLMNRLATSVVGDRSKSHTIDLWFGSGGNGKSLKGELLGSAFGDYLYNAMGYLFFGRTAGCDNAPLELAGRRIIFMSESEPGYKPRADLLEAVSGDRMLASRDKRQYKRRFKCRANLVLCFSIMPDNKTMTPELRRRIRILPHPVRYLSKWELEHRALSAFLKPARTDLSDLFRSKRCGAAFLGMLIERYNEAGLEFAAPESIVDLASASRERAID